MQKPIKFCTIIFLFFLGLFIVLELSLLLLSKTHPIFIGIDAWQPVRERVHPLWSSNNQIDPFHPPYPVYSNTDLQNSNRLKMITNKLALPADTEWVTHDFLRLKSDETKYKVSTNEFGYRSTGPSVANPKIRIAVYGSYHSFGHGVSDSDTYPYQLQELMNNTRQEYVRVFNGARQGATAIMGLGRLKNDFEQIKPNIVIFDFGFVDTGIKSDNHFPAALLFPNHGPASFLRFVFQTPFLNFFLHSRLMAALHWKFSNKVEFERRKANMLNALKEALLFCKEKQIPIIFLSQSNDSFRPEDYSTLIDSYSKAIVVDVLKLFQENKPSKELQELFINQKNWHTEDNLHNMLTAYVRPMEYYTDVFHYNRNGHAVVSNHLVQVISKLNQTNEINR